MSAMAQIQRSLTAARDQKKYTNTDGPGGSTIDYGPGQQDPRFAGGAAPYGTSPWYGRNGEADPMPWSGPPGQSVGQRAPRYTPDAGDPRNAGYYVPTPTADQQAATDARNQAFRDAGAAKLAGNAGYQSMLQAYQNGQISQSDWVQARTRANLGLDATQLYNPNQGWPTPTMANGQRAPGAPTTAGGPMAQQGYQPPAGAQSTAGIGGGGFNGKAPWAGGNMGGAYTGPAFTGMTGGGGGSFSGSGGGGGGPQMTMNLPSSAGGNQGAPQSPGGGGFNGKAPWAGGNMGGAYTGPAFTGMTGGGGGAMQGMQQMMPAAAQNYGQQHVSTGQASASPYGPSGNGVSMDLGGSPYGGFNAGSSIGNYGSFGPQMLNGPYAQGQNPGDMMATQGRTGPTFNPPGGPPGRPINGPGIPPLTPGTRPDWGQSMPWGQQQPFQQQPYGGPMPYDTGGGMTGFAGFSPYGGGGGQGYGQPMNQGYGAPQGYGGGYGGGYGSYGY